MKNEDTSLQSSPQLALREQNRGAVALSGKQVVSLYKKSQQSGIPFDVLEEVYMRGYSESLSEQIAFNRVNSFISDGAALEMDKDLLEKRGLWDNIWAKRRRIAHGSGEHMRKPGEKGAPTAAALKASQTEAVNPAQQAAIAIAMKKAGKKPKNEEYTGAEKVSKDKNDPSSRFVGTSVATEIYRDDTPGQSARAETIKRVVSENWQNKKYKNPEGGLTQAGVNAYRREHPGSHLKTAVTTEPSKLKKGSKAANRRKSFCARMGGMKKRLTSAKTAHDPDSRINKALRKWHCHEDTSNELNIHEVSAELVGKVNKARLDTPSKTKTASETLRKAVNKKWLDSKVGVVKEK